MEEWSVDEIDRLCLQVFDQSRESPPPYNEDCGLTSEDFAELIACSNPPDLKNARSLQVFLDEHKDSFCPRKNGIGYPIGALHLHISYELARWLSTGECTGRVMKAYEQLDEGDYPQKRAETFDSLNESVKGAATLWSLWNDEEKKFFLEKIIMEFGKRGLLDILGCRKTTGTHAKFPPPRELLMEAFESKHTDRSYLTVGARALAKHHHRDSAAFWGDSTGTESDKNRHALEVVTKILDNATWINIHELPGQLPIIEMRVDEGYGARWSVDGTAFRGFLEPMMKEGWLNKYRH